MEAKTVAARIGMTSLVGIGGIKYPLSFGNYFALSSGQYVLNFWAENFNEAVRRFLDDGSVRVLVSGALCIIDDDRIPADWYNEKLYCCGISQPNRDVWEEFEKSNRSVNL